MQSSVEVWEEGCKENKSYENWKYEVGMKESLGAVGVWMLFPINLESVY